MSHESARWNGALGWIAYHWPVWLAVLAGVWVVLPWLAPMLICVGVTGPAYLICLRYSP